MIRQRLSSSIKFQLIYQDETKFGSAVTGQCDTTIRRYCASITEHRNRYGLADVVVHSRDLLALTMVPGGLADLYQRHSVLLEDWLYPDTKAVKPIALELERNIGKTIVIQELSPNLLSDLALNLSH